MDMRTAEHEVEFQARVARITRHLEVDRYVGRIYAYHAHPAATDESDPIEDHRRDRPRGSWEARS